MIAFKVAVTAGLLVIGGLLVLNQQMNIGQFVAAEIVILLVIASVEKLIVSLETLYDMLTSIEKLGEVLDFDLESQEGKRPNYPTAFKLELKGVGYHVKDRERPILDQIDLTFEPGKTYLLRGASGSGKSSLLRVIAGVSTPTSGAVFVDDQNLKSIQPNHYRTQLGLSLSEQTPFEGSLRENLIFDRTDVTDKDLITVAKTVGLDEFIKELPQGLDSQIQAEGRHISYTISKKILLARAILKRPKVLVLEDPLDQFTKDETASIIDYLTDPNQPWTLVVVSANEYWANRCHELIELEDGKVKHTKSNLSC